MSQKNSGMYRAPRKNRAISDTQRNKYFNKRLIEWKSEYQRIYREKDCKSDIQGIRSFVARVKLSDHITRELLSHIGNPWIISRTYR